jgi:hypothetical protein
MEEITNTLQVTIFEVLGALKAVVSAVRIGERAPLRGIPDVQAARGEGAVKVPDST